MYTIKHWLASVLAAFIAGGYVHGLYNDSLALAAVNAAVAAQEVANKRETEQALALDAWLSKHAKNTREIVRETVKLVDRPVYRNVCLDDDGLRLANAAKNGTAIEPADAVQDSR